MSKLDKDQVIAAFTDAYTAANAPAIEAKGGWYSVDGGKNMRLADLETLIAGLAPSDPAKNTKAAAEKPKKVTEKKVAKTPAKKKIKKSDFSVKGFWANKILENQSGAKLPR
jgi:hypothetical protein